MTAIDETLRDASSLNEKVVIITGAAWGMGAAEAKYLASQGATVVLTDVKDSAGRALAEKLVEQGGQASYLPLDVSDEAAWEKCVATVVERFGRVNALINNAGITQPTEGISTTDRATWDQLIAVNLTGPFLGIKAVAPLMRAASSGSIVNVSSAAGLSGFPKPAYTATKWGLRGLTKTAALEFGPANVRVNTILPGSIETEMNPDSPLKNAFIAATPLGRAASPSEVAYLAAFLCSDASAYINGADIPIDGGFAAASPMKAVSALRDRLLGQ